MAMNTIQLANGMRLEVRTIAPDNFEKPSIVFLHEGLGSVSLWRDFPDRIAHAIGVGAIIYSRHGYGQSGILEKPRAPDYMHREALDVLPQLLRTLDIEKPILFGHSDGASIALIHAGAGHEVAGLILEAPHVFVEQISLKGVADAALAYRTTDLPEKLARHHRDPDKTFWDWHDIWTSADFRDWNIEAYLPSIDCPTLLIQGENDAYGSVAQLDAIAHSVNGSTQKHILPHCGHTPHREQAELTMKLIVEFIRENKFF
jgi:pimeloyl-ACP methyl ester carboxylesterase